MRRYDNSDFEQVNNIYNMNDLQRYLKWAQDDIEDIQRYIKALAEQAQKAVKAEQRHYINIYRNHNRWGDKKVHLFVSIRTEIYVDGEKQRATPPYNSEFEKLRKEFAGTERKQAFEYAETLRKKYNFKIMKEGF
jgi:prefoldin subunit 5